MMFIYLFIYLFILNMCTHFWEEGLLGSFPLRVISGIKFNIVSAFGKSFYEICLNWNVPLKKFDVKPNRIMENYTE